MTVPALPERLRSEVARDLEPVRPLPPPWRRAVVVAVVAAAVLVVTVATSRLRSDMDFLPMWLTWGAALVEVLVGLLLIAMALRESVPGTPVAPGWAALAATSALAVQLAVAGATWMYSDGSAAADLAAGMGCLAHESSLALPAFLVTMVLVARALPVRPAMAGLLGGLGAGLTADGVDHLLCPVSHPSHVMVWHTGAILVFMVAGYLAGRAYEWVRDRRDARP